MPQSFQWSVHKNNPVDGFTTGSSREMRVSSSASSAFSVQVDIEGSNQGTVAPGGLRTFRLPSKPGSRVAIRKFDNSDGTASGTCDLQ